MHPSINEWGLCQSLAYLITSPCLGSKIVLKLNNILVVHLFPNIFSEVSLGCSLTVILRTWSCWFHVNHPFSKNLCWIPLSWLVKLNNNLESWKIKALPNLVHFKWISFVCVCVQERRYLHWLILVISCSCYYHIQSLNWLWAIVKSNQNQQCS